MVTAVIAWTYLHHAFFRREGIDYRYFHNVNGVREARKTANGAETHWDLGRCLRVNKCPLDKDAKDNLEFLIELRHEIEHRSTSRVDEAVSAKLQACCINFNEALVRLFDPQYGLEKRLPLALQFATFSSDQRATLKRSRDLPRHIATMMDAFHDRLTTEEQSDPHFAYHVAFVPRVVNRPGSADEAIEFVRPGSDEAIEINRVLLKEVEKSKFRPGQIVTIMKKEGYRWFNIQAHTDWWHSLNAKDPAKGYGTLLSDGQWYWYQTWLNRVREHCEQQRQLGPGGRVTVGC